MTRRSMQGLFALVCAVAIAFEAYVLFADRSDEFAIVGENQYEVTEFSAGTVVSHAFYMRGNGLNAVRVQLSAATPSRARVQWTLWRGYVIDGDDKMVRISDGAPELLLTAGRQWVTFDVIRDGSSNDRWYTLELRLIGTADASDQGGEPPAVNLVASRDNPERGGILFVDGTQREGSLLLIAGRQMRPLARRFSAEVAPNLPAVLRMPGLQWVAVVVLHWAFFTYAYAVLMAAVPARRD